MAIYLENIQHLIDSIEGFQKRVNNVQNLKAILQNCPPGPLNAQWQMSFKGRDDEFEILIRYLKERQQKDEEIKRMEKEVNKVKYLHLQTYRQLQEYNPSFTHEMLEEKVRLEKESEDVQVVNRLNQEIFTLKEELKNTMATRQQVENRDIQLAQMEAQIAMTAVNNNKVIAQMESQISMMAEHNDKMILKMTKDHDLNIKLLDAKVDEKEEIIASLKNNSKQMETKLKETEESLKVLEEGLEEKEYISMLKQKNLELEEKIEKMQMDHDEALKTANEIYEKNIECREYRIKNMQGHLIKEKERLRWAEHDLCKSDQKLEIKRREMEELQKNHSNDLAEIRKENDERIKELVEGLDEKILIRMMSQKNTELEMKIKKMEQENKTIIKNCEQSTQNELRMMKELDMIKQENLEKVEVECMQENLRAVEGRLYFAQQELKDCKTTITELQRSNKRDAELFRSYQTDFDMQLTEKNEKIKKLEAQPKALEQELEELRTRLSQLEMSQPQSPNSLSSHGSKRSQDDEHPETPTNRRMRISENEDVASPRSDDSDSWDRLSSDDIESIP